MISISQKCQYALRAVFELALHNDGTPISIADIAAAQAIPPRFLELILNELRQAGFVESRRGVRGGYLLMADPAELTVGHIIRQVDGPVEPVKCISTGGAECPMKGNCIFADIWKQAREATEEVFARFTYEELVRRHAAAKVGQTQYTI